ncbi:MAG: SIS domain-containing protein [Firmicutes bacterium]|nr:SIS domain-containing protein [Bacillota bacterium]
MKLDPCGHLEQLLERYPPLAVCRESIWQGFQAIKAAFAAGGKLLVCGNGGSAADAEHIVGELMKGFLRERAVGDEWVEKFREIDTSRGPQLARALQLGLPAVALSAHTALNTAVGNDNGGDLIFAQQVFVLGQPEDVLLGITTSGNSTNVVKAMITAKAKGMTTVGLTGANQGEVASFCDVQIRVPAASTPVIQEYHLPVYHGLCAMLEAEFF